MSSRGHAEPFEGPHTQALDYIGENPIYIGLAALGSSKAAAVWQIRELVWIGSNLMDVRYANGSTDFTSVWNDRASLSYP